MDMGTNTYKIYNLYIQYMKYCDDLLECDKFYGQKVMKYICWTRR